ncbi:hypothetical protein [Methanothrix sp.]|uniref:hypothetical protein n=1 Tax=Methanothrix sp. TaxID=90426 RepID=UPI003C757A07
MKRSATSLSPAGRSKAAVSPSKRQRFNSCLRSKCHPLHLIHRPIPFLAPILFFIPIFVFIFILISILISINWIHSSTASLYGCELAEEWNRTYGGRYGDGAWCVQETADGGYILVGNTAIRGEGSDLWLIRTDADGGSLWSRVLGGSNEDAGYFVRETADGGYIIAGSSYSFGMGGERLWLIRMDGNGSLIWDRTFGGFVHSSGDGGWSVDETDDGGYIATGYTQSKGNGRKDLWLLRTDDKGDLLWDRSYGGAGDDVGLSVLQSRDGGFIVAGRTASLNKKGDDDIWLLKTDDRGVMAWNATYGGDGDDAAFQVVELADGYALVGRSESGAEKERIILIRVDHLGRKIWERSYLGGSGASLQQTADGGFVIGGRIDREESGRDGLIIKTNSAGEEMSRLVLGGMKDDICSFVIQNRKGDYILAGITSSYGSGAEDAWLVKVISKDLREINAHRLENLTASLQYRAGPRRSL